MKKALFTQLIFLFFAVKTYAQTSPDEFNPIEKFIESTVQIPFMARVADVQENVEVLVTLNAKNNPESFVISKGLRSDCNVEALRVVKLINPKYFSAVYKNEKKITIKVPFLNASKLNFVSGFITEYFDKEKKVTPNIAEAKFAVRYLVDTLTGIPKYKLEYFNVKNQELSPLDYGLLKVDNKSSYNPSFMENPADSIRYSVFSEMKNSELPSKIYNEIYANGQIRTKIEGPQEFVYYPNGRVKLEVLESKEAGMTFIHKWYANGLLESIKFTQKNKLDYTEGVTAAWDTTGKQIVIDGYGNFESFSGNKKELYTETGLVKNGVKEGKWVSKYVSGKKDNVEFYENGLFKKGVNYFMNDSTTYSSREENAEYNGGLASFARHLQSNLKYPADAQKNNVSGKVYVQFVVCTDGTLCDYKVLKSVGYGCDEESLRVLALSSGNWKPGKQKGRKVRSRFTLPINFSLGR